MPRLLCAILAFLTPAAVADDAWRKKLEQRGKHWSFHKPQRPPLPDLKTTHPAFWAKHGSRIRTPIDAFVFAKLAELGLEPAPTADQRTLIRRASFDLIGLPPSPEEVETF